MSLEQVRANMARLRKQLVESRELPVGFHQFPGGFGSYEVFESENQWWWHLCQPGQAPEDHPHGPFKYEFLAHQDARRWWGGK